MIYNGIMLAQFDKDSESEIYLYADRDSYNRHKEYMTEIKGYVIESESVLDNNEFFKVEYKKKEEAGIERGYAIRTIGYQRSGELYKTGYLGEGFYVSIYEAALWEDRKEVLKALSILRNDNRDGTVEFVLCRIQRHVKEEVVSEE